MSGRISADWSTLYGQSQYVSRDFLKPALAAIKEELGTEKRKATLEEITLAVRLSYVSSADFACTALGVFADKLSDSLDNIARALDE